MQHFFTEPENINENRVLIVGEDVNHIKNVLRMKPGEEISISNGIDDNDYRCEIAEITDTEVICKLMFVKKAGLELPVNIVLFQGLPKNDKMELIIQKAVELGVYEIVPVATKRAVVKLDEKKAKSKIERWQLISEAAAKQSKRAIVPKVSEVMNFKAAIKLASEYDVAAIPYELADGMEATKNFVEKVVSIAEKSADKKPAFSKPNVAVFIGPEGGFDEDEIKFAIDNSINPVSLGKRILRTETAGMTVLSILMYSLEIYGEKANV